VSAGRFGRPRLLSVGKVTGVAISLMGVTR
jgi:hypothetical protein